MEPNALQKKVREFPKAPGVYLMKGQKGEILYVGKASNLRSRVQSYFSNRADSRYQIRFLMSKVNSIEPLVTDNAKEALLLENTLIKKHRPRYNLDLKDDKSFLSLKLSIKDESPRLYVTRRIKKDGNLYYGPYTSAASCREVVDFIQKHFRLRTCSDHDYRNRVRPCLQYQIKRCDAPCVGYISLEEYKKIIEQVRLFIEGHNQPLRRLAQNEMQKASSQERFEEAARYRDLLKDIDITLEKQKVVSHTAADRDVIGLHREGPRVMVYLMMVREGTLQDQVSYFLKSYEEDEDLIATFLTQYYREGRSIPREILVPRLLEDASSVEQILSERSHHTLKLVFPRRGEKVDLLKMGNQNANLAFTRQLQKEKNQEEILEELQSSLRLKELPRRMECYDISNIQGKESIGSMVTFLGGVPAPKLYRLFKIKTVAGANDFASLYEVLSRRLRRSRATQGQEIESPWALPNLMIIDGGKGQLNAAIQATKDLGVEGVELISLAKSRLLDSPPLKSSPGKERSEERVFLRGRKDPVFLNPRSSALFLLMKARDEAHRFGIESHRKLRKRTSLVSALDKIEGVGKVRRQKLLQVFGSLKRIKAAEVSDLAKALGASPELARRIKESI